MLIPILETQRLIIRPARMDDLEACHRLFLEIRWADAKLSDEENLGRRREWLEWTIRNYVELDRLNQPPYGDHVIALKENAQFAGLIGLVPLLAPFAQLPYFGEVEAAPFSAEVGLFWAVSPALQGKGFATEAARALVNYVFGTLKLGRILAGTEYNNAPSITVMRRLGMRIEKNPFPEPPWFQVTGILEARAPS
ncbi:MAG: GNAT family N-acetyltransferase [Candidatus Binataceae bacterium]